MVIKVSVLLVTPLNEEAGLPQFAFFNSSAGFSTLWTQLI